VCSSLRINVEALPAKRFGSALAGLEVARSQQDRMSTRGELGSDRKTDATIGTCPWRIPKVMQDEGVVVLVR
jgi:hypothetical protein